MPSPTPGSILTRLGGALRSGVGTVLRPNPTPGSILTRLGGLILHQALCALLRHHYPRPAAKASGWRMLLPCGHLARWTCERGMSDNK
eukprot:1143017-Pelagomonas_calceolata.AAC.4